MITSVGHGYGQFSIQSEQEPNLYHISFNFMSQLLQINAGADKTSQALNANTN